MSPTRKHGEAAAGIRGSTTNRDRNAYDSHLQLILWDLRKVRCAGLRMTCHRCAQPAPGRLLALWRTRTLVRRFAKLYISTHCATRRFVAADKFASPLLPLRARLVVSDARRQLNEDKKLAIGNTTSVDVSADRIHDAHVAPRGELPPMARAVSKYPLVSGLLHGLLESSRSSISNRMASAMRWGEYACTRATKERFARVHSIFGTLIDETTERKPDLAYHETWVTALLDTMKKGNYVTQNGAEYIHLPGIETHDVHTRWTDFAGDTSDAARAAKRHFPDLAIAVPGYRGRKPDDGRRLLQLNCADAIVLANGDLHAPYQIVEVLRCLRSGKVRATPIVVPGPVFDFYQPLWRGLFGEAPTDQSARAFYQAQLTHWIRSGKNSDRDAPILFPESLDEIVSADINATIGIQRSSRLEVPDGVDVLDAIFVKPQIVAQLYVGTTKQEKAEHWRLCIKGQDVEIRLLMEAIDKLGDPKERHKGYLGNVRGIDEPMGGKALAPRRNWLSLPQPYRFGARKTAPQSVTENSGKAEANIRTIRQVLKGEHPELSREDFLQRLKSFGVDAARGDKLHFLNDDRGFEIPEWSKIEPYFNPQVKKAALDLIARNVGGQNLKLQAVPGVETTWWINAAGGIEALMMYFLDAFEAYERATGERLERKVASIVAVSVSEMDLNKPDVTKVRNFSGATTFALRRPAPSKPADTSECWYVPIENNPEQRSIQEHMDGIDGVPNFDALLPWVKVSRAMQAAGIEFHNARGKRRVADYRIDFVGEQRDMRGAALQQHLDGYVKARLPAARAAGSIAPDEPVIERAMSLRHRQMFDGYAFNPYDILDRAERSDAMVFDSVPSDVASQARVFYEFFSALVFSSLHPDYKGMQVMFNANDPQLKALVDLVGTQRKFALSEDISTMAQPYSDENEVVAALESHWNGHERIRTPSAQRGEPEVIDLSADFRRNGRPPRPSVVVLGSGKAENPGAVSGATTMADWIARKGFDARTGGGAKGVMGTVGRHYRAVVDEVGNGGLIAGISTLMVLGKETDTGKLPDELHFAPVTEDIVTRMVELFGAEMGAFLDGGVGTAQEIFFVIALKAVGHPLVAGKPMVAVNSLMPDGQRLMDGYMVAFGAGDSALTTREAQIAKGRKIFEAMDIHMIDPGQDDADEVITRECNRIAELYGIAMDSALAIGRAVG